MSIANDDLSKISSSDSVQFNLDQFDGLYEKLNSYQAEHGLKNADDVQRFLGSPSGEKLVNEIADELEIEKDIKETQQLQSHEQELKQELIRAFLARSLLDEESEFRKMQIESAEQDKILKEEQAAHKKAIAPTPEPKESAPSSFNSDFADLQKELETEEQELSTKLDSLQHEKELITDKHKTYEQSLESLDKSIEQYDKEPNKLDKKIAALEKEVSAMTPKIEEQLDKGNEAKARKLLDKQNAMNLQIASLKDIQSKQDDKLVFLDANLEKTNPQNSLFALPKDMQLVKQDQHYYLLGKDEQWNNSEQQKLAASARYEKEKPNIMSVKNLVGQVKQQELSLNEKQYKAANEQLSLNREKQALFKNQMAQSHTSAQSLTKKPADEPLTMRPPQSSITNKNLSSKFVKTISPHDENPSWGSIFKFVETIHPDKRNEANKLVDKALEKEKLPESDKKSLKNLSAHELKLELMKQLKDTRVPTLTMQHFIEVMPEFEDAYKPNVATATSPVRLRNEESTPNNTPTSNR